MQSREFDTGMYEGFDKAKWMDLADQEKLAKRIAQSPKFEKREEIRKLIQTKEVYIPTEKAEEIQAFVDQQRRWSVPEQNIRRKVKKKFGIVVV